jgi:hypothetical protein
MTVQRVEWMELIKRLFQITCKAAKNCVIIQGFADHGEVSKKVVKGLLCSLKIYSR